MKILESGQILQFLTNLVYEKKQVHFTSVDLTVKSIAKVLVGGSLDFGGSEYKSAEREVIEPEKAGPSEKYGWWSLDEGDYFVEYNEELSLPSGCIAIIQPHERIIESGITHATRFLTESDDRPIISMIHVGRGRVHIKENARISNLIVARTG
jgi:hypothetical protein